MTITIKPVTSYRLLVLHEGHSRKIVKSPFQYAQIHGPNYTANCKCTHPRHREVHNQVHAARDAPGLRVVFTTALTAHRPEQIFIVKGGMYGARFETIEGVNEVAGHRFLATVAFVNTETQKNDLKNAYRDWANIKICVVPDLHERLLDERSLNTPDHEDKSKPKEISSPNNSEDAYSIPRRFFSWL